MFRFILVLALLSVSVTPLDARERPKDTKRMEKSERADLRRDVERISKEIYPPRDSRRRR